MLKMPTTDTWVIKPRIVVWSLYDDASMSYDKALALHINVENHSIGINHHPEVVNYHRIDLSLTNIDLRRQIDLLPKPDVILASPPCESWSTADSITRSIQYKNGKFFNQSKKFYDEFNANCKINHRKRDYFRATRTRILGELTINALIWIIEYVKPKVWVIENPENSLSWKYQEEVLNFYGIMNKTYYCNWNENSVAKPTIFKSNIDLELPRKKAPLGQIIQWEKAQGYELRSSIPHNLIQYIFERIEQYVVQESTKSIIQRK